MEQAMKVASAAASAAEKAVDAVPNAITKAMPASDHIPPQRQDQPGVEAEMNPKPEYIKEDYKGSGKLSGKVAIITGGDSGIGRAVAVHYAREGAAGIAILYKAPSEEVDAKTTIELVEKEGGKCIAVQGDVGDPQTAQKLVDQTLSAFGRLDILINNAAEQHYRHSITEITQEQLLSTFKTNIFGMFYMVKAALPHLKEGSSIINTTSVTAYVGEPELLDYSATKGCIVTFTRSLAQQLTDKGIRVNGVAPGPIWTPLIPATFPKATQPMWKSSAPMKRAGQPSECAPAYVFLGSEDGSYFSGQVLHPNGGMPVNS